jgi:hypothetical protein
MSSRRRFGGSGRGRWLAFGSRRTLSARLITGILLLLVGACTVIGVVTYLAIRSSMISALDGQLRSASGTYASCMETNHQGTPGRAATSLHRAAMLTTTDRRRRTTSPAPAGSRSGCWGCGSAATA